MPFLVDTSVLARLANSADLQYSQAAQAVVELHRRNEVLHVTPQNLVEFRNVATRPREVNGLGLPLIEAEAKAAVFEATFPLLPETSAIFPIWKMLVATANVIGKQVHDARLVAVCHVHSMTHLLTFNVGHFGRIGAIGQGVSVVHPSNITLPE